MTDLATNRILQLFSSFPGDFSVCGAGSFNEGGCTEQVTSGDFAPVPEAGTALLAGLGLAGLGLVRKHVRR